MSAFKHGRHPGMRNYKLTSHGNVRLYPHAYGEDVSYFLYTPFISGQEESSERNNLSRSGGDGSSKIRRARFHTTTCLTP